MGFGGPVIKEGRILVISIVTLQHYYGDLGEVCASTQDGWKYRTFWYLPLFHPAHYSIYIYRDIWVLGVPL